MARIRSVKPDFFRHELLNQLEDENPTLRVMLSFQGLWLQSDKQGVFPYKPKTLKLDILPWVNYKIEDTMELLVKHGFILKFNYQGKEYGYIPSFPNHQRISGEEAKQPARYPSYDMRDAEGSRKEAGRKQEGNTEELPACPGNGVGEREWSREEGEGSALVFSKTEALNPNTQNKEQIFQQLKTAWNDNCRPRCKINTTLTMTYVEREEWFIASTRIEDPFRACKAMQNYGGICAGDEYEATPSGYGFLGFLLKGVEQYADDAKPFERCRKKPRFETPERAQSVEVPDSEETARLIDELKSGEKGVFEFNAAEAMEQIRSRGNG